MFVMKSFTRESPVGMVGTSETMCRLYQQAEQLAQSNTAVLIQGESGTGKELVARALHDLGPRAGKPFVTFDCAAVTHSLVTSALFGHEPGSFTGAQGRHAGVFEQAHGGTLFLDEIGELPLTLQTHLLGTIERRRFYRIGGTEEVEVDVRVISATNRDLMTGVDAGQFRLDLFYRLSVVTMQLPPLRERLDDLPLLVDHFARLCGYKGPLDQLLPPKAMADLRAHRWPGNVRELRNLVEAAIATGETLRPRLASSAPTATADPIAALLGMAYKDARAEILEQFEQRYLKAIWSKADGNLTRAARTAQMDRAHLATLLERHELRGAAA